MDTRSMPLRTALYANAAFSGVSGLLFALVPGRVESLLGWAGGEPVIRLLGLGLLGFAAFVYYVAAREPAPKRLVLGIVAADGLWVLGSVALLIGGWVPLSPEGRWVVGGLALAVDVFATAQYLSWRTLS